MKADELKRYDAYPHLLKVVRAFLRADRENDTRVFRVKHAAAVEQAKALLKAIGERP